MKYIDADKLIAEIERHINHYESLNRDDFKNGELYICQELLSFIKSLQQEQPEMDLDAFRREAAKDILCAMIHHQNSTDPSEISIAIDIADELIKQLKEERK